MNVNQKFSSVDSLLVSATVTQGPQSRIEIEGKVGGQECTWLLDTGGQISVLSENIARTTHGVGAPAQYTPCTVNGSSMYTVCDLITDRNIGRQVIRQHRFTIVRECTYPAILRMISFLPSTFRFSWGTMSVMTMHVHQTLKLDSHPN